MRKILICTMCLLTAFCLQTFGQTKAQTLQHIRELYAQAKEKVAQNGKDGKSPKDMTITLNRLEDEEVELYDMLTITYYFDETRTEGVTTKQPYFIVENWSNHGHLRYREVLLNPTSQKVIFCYMRGETDGGFVVESRYYYNEQGTCIETKHNTPNSWTTEDSEKENAEFYLEIFGMVNYNGYFTPLDVNAPQKRTTPKAQRLSHIREIYAQAKDRVASNATKEMPDELYITIHDLGDDMPPRTTDIKFYFDAKGCYFISRHATSMMSDGYEELLFEPNSQDLIFSYTRGREEGQEFEWRYYYDENGNCIETKTNNTDETDDGFYDKRHAKDLQAIFRKLTE